MKQTYSKHPIHNPSLPIYFLAGQDDPCIINTKKFNQAIAHQQRLGYLDVNSHLFIDMRHEILNEKNNDIVYQYILDLLKTWQK